MKKFDTTEVKRLIDGYMKDKDNQHQDNQKVAVDILAWSLLQNSNLKRNNIMQHIRVKEIQEYEYVVSFENTAHCQAFLDMIKKLDSNLI